MAKPVRKDFSKNVFSFSNIIFSLVQTKYRAKPFQKPIAIPSQRKYLMAKMLMKMKTTEKSRNALPPPENSPPD